MTQELFIKICGITNLPDAKLAVQMGANAVGFIFYERSPRFVSPEHALEIARGLPDHTTRIGVFVNATKKHILDVAAKAKLSAVQLYGTEGPDDLVDFEVSVIKAFRVHPDFDVEIMRNFLVDAFLLDTFLEGSFGGTGKSFDWNIAVKAKEFGRVILSGGLTPENVDGAVRFVQPYGVDVSSGVESSPGKKDPARMRDFIANARNASLLAPTEPNHE